MLTDFSDLICPGKNLLPRDPGAHPLYGSVMLHLPLVLELPHNFQVKFQNLSQKHKSPFEYAERCEVPVCVICLVMSNSATPWTIVCQAPLSMGFSRQEYGSGQPFPSLGIFPTQGSNLGLLHCSQIPYCLSQRCQISEL